MIAQIFELQRLSAVPTLAGRPRTDDEDRRLIALRNQLQQVDDTPDDTRRGWSRFQLGTNATVVRQGGRSYARVLDASGVGFRIFLMEGLALDEEVQVVIGSDGASYTFTCLVVWQSPNLTEHGLWIQPSRMQLSFGMR